MGTLVSRHWSFSKKNQTTLKKTIEELNLQIRELKSRNILAENKGKEVTRFLAVASHDLRQPVHALSLYLGALDNLTLPDRAKKILSSTLQCAQTVDDMLLTLLDISRVNAGVVSPNMQVFPVSKLLKKIQIEFHPIATCKGLKLRIAPCSAWVRGDATFIEQILRNLVANAARYTEQGTILIGCRRKGDSLRLSVIDTGIGIAEDQIKDIFDEFSQGSHGKTHCNVGLGLGLAVVQHLAGWLSIPITLKSKLGSGSMFAIDLPIAPGYGERKGTGDERIDQRYMNDSILNPLYGKHVFVIDDDEFILDSICVLLRRWGCEVKKAKSAAHVHQWLSEEQRCPDILIGDLWIARDEIGLQLIDSIQMKFGRRIPTLILSGTIHTEAQTYISARGWKALYKPILPTVLYETLLSLNGSRCVASVE